MPNRTPILASLVLLALLGGCERRSGDVEALDQDLLNAAGDNAGDAALGDEIVVDPALTHAGNKQAAKAARAQLPGAPGQGGPAADCYDKLGFDNGWAKRLPVGVPLYGDAKVSEAAGNDRPDCRISIVSYVSAAPTATLIRFYMDETRKAGFAVEHTRRNGDLVVAGDRATDGAAFYVTVTSRGQSGSDVDVIARTGG